MWEVDRILSTKMPQLKVLVFVASLAPILELGWRAYVDELGANPIEFVTQSTGLCTLVFLLTTLAVTPLRQITGLNQLIRFRRMLGLFTFFYACLHLGTYVILDQFFDFGAIMADVLKRPYITMGFAAFVLMVPLAATSTRRMIARLGHRWQLLHRLIYVSATAGVIHFLWLAKADLRQPILYASVLALLLGYRLIRTLAQRRRTTRQRDQKRIEPDFGTTRLHEPKELGRKLLLSLRSALCSSGRVVLHLFQVL